MKPEKIAIKQWLNRPEPEPVVCGCLGPKNDDPVCPCRMRWFEKVDGDWYWIREIKTFGGDGLEISAVRYDQDRK